MKDHVSIRIESAAFEPDTVRIVELSGTETVSRLFELQLRLVSTDPAGFDEEKLMTSLVALVFERTGTTGVVTEERRIVGMICTLRDRALVQAGHREVLVTFVPRAWQTTLTKTSDIFMDLTVPQILEKKLEGIGLGSQDVELRLKGTYAPREFVVQYKESDHDFICRLAEDLGIHFFFEEKDGKDHLVFGDHNEAFKDSQPQAAPFSGGGDRTSVYQLEATRQVVPKQFKTRDYNYRNPGMDLLGEASNNTLAAGGVVDEFGPHAKTGEEVTFYAKIRSEEALCRHLTFEGESELPGLRAGSVLLVEGHPRGEMELAVIEVKHRATQASLGQAEGANVPYANTFRAIPMNVTYRPPRITPKPVVHGVVTGVVESGSSTNFGAIDEEGRYRVSFMYDTVSERGEGKASRPLRMAQPSAGADRGFHQPLKAGTEVVITCLNGDPDRPIIAGAVPNPQTPSPVTSANAEKSMWKTNVNQIAIDDDKPRMKMTVNGEEHVFQIGEPNGPEFGFMQGTAGNSTSMTDNVATTYSTIKSSWDSYKNGFASDNIVNGAGIPNPWAKWKKWEALANAAVTTVKSASSLLEAGAGLLEGDLATAKSEKEDADKAKADAAGEKVVADAKLKAEVERAKVDPASLAPRANAPKDGGPVVPETRAQALDRAYKEHAAKSGTDTRLENAMQAAKDADKEAAAKASAAQDIDGRIAIAESDRDKRHFIDTDTRELTINNIKDGAKWLEDTQAKIKSLQEKAANLVKVASLIPGAKKLFSVLSSKLGKIAHAAVDKTTNGFQLGAAMHAKSAAPRTGTKIGRFGDPHNIQYARGTVALHGTGNAFVFGADAATLSSRGHANVVGLDVARVTSPKLVEAAAKEVLVSAKSLVDIYSGDNLKLVAHSGDKSIAMPAGHSMHLRSQKGILIESSEKDVEIKAKKNLKVEVEDENFELKVKKDVLVQVAEGDFMLHTDKGKGEIMTKGTLDVVSEDVATIHSKKDMFLKTDAEMNIESAKDMKWKAANFHLNTKKVVMKGSKISLA